MNKHPAYALIADQQAVAIRKSNLKCFCRGCNTHVDRNPYTNELTLNVRVITGWNASHLIPVSVAECLCGSNDLAWFD